MRAITDEDSARRLMVRIEPSVNRATTLLLARKMLVRRSAGSLTLTETGRAAADEIEKSGNAFVDEITFMKVLHRKLTDKIVNLIFWKREA